MIIINYNQARRYIDSQKKIILLSSLGVIPFYSDMLIIYLNNFYNFKLFQNLNLVSFFYGSLISSFLCGMHWINFINTKKKILSIPMIPIILLWISYLFLEIKSSEQKIRVGLRQTQADPFDWFKDKSKNQTITVKVVSTDNKGLIVRPEGCEMDFQIKKSAIAINAADARPSRWTGGEKLDCAIADLDLSKRKVVLSIKLLEEIEKKEALEKYGSEGSGKNLPFSSLSDDLKKKEEEKE